MTRCLLLLAVVLIFGSAASAQTRSFQPGAYAEPDGALLMTAHGNYVEPYFATKALLVAADSGLNIRETALAWIGWLLPHQNPDGRFNRYCRKEIAWTECGAADADDSMLALWLELLYRSAPDSGLPLTWQHSAEMSRSYLASLRNSRLGVYHVSHRNHSALFMDNVEVYGSLRQIAAAEHRFHDEQHAQETDRQVQELSKSIDSVFWNNHAQRYMPANQKMRPGFYPDVVAQAYPWLADLPTPEGDARKAWTRWKQYFAPMWLTNRYDPHAWGLLAVAAVKVGDDATATCWLERAAVHRGDAQWNILEESSFQSVKTRVENSEVNPTVCNAMVSGQ